MKLLDRDLPCAFDRHRVRVGDTPIAYQVGGEGPPVVLIHGLSGSARWWARNVDALAERCRVYAVDLVGFGASRRRQRFVLAEAAAVLAAWMDRLGLERASVVGHSMGGFVAAELAADFPERVARLVLVAPAVLPYERRLWHPTRGLLRMLRHLPGGFLPLLVADAVRAGPLTVPSAARQLLTADLRPKLARIAAPTLVVCGARDALVPLAATGRLARQLPDAKLVVIPDAGHNTMWEQPEAFNRVVRGFLAAGLVPA
ncbi:MAG: alpha/beta fold hydrolase [Chloroflexota bacterium]|nr:alpha/beta fold hydrolase [Chloroflexota bacterium]